MKGLHYITATGTASLVERDNPPSLGEIESYLGKGFISVVPGRMNDREVIIIAQVIKFGAAPSPRPINVWATQALSEWLTDIEVVQPHPKIHGDALVCEGWTAFEVYEAIADMPRKALPIRDTIWAMRRPGISTGELH